MDNDESNTENEFNWYVQQKSYLAPKRKVYALKKFLTSITHEPASQKI